MGRVLVDNVAVDGVTYAVGSTPTDPDVVARIGDHCWREEEAGPGIGPAELPPAPEQSFAVEEVGPSIFAVAEVATDGEPESARVVAVEPPPTSGKGSSETAWRAYAKSLGIHVDDANDRAEVMATIDAELARRESE